MNRSFSACLVLAAAMLLMIGGGCTHYFRVTEPTSDRVYYTKGIDRTRTGAVRFHNLSDNAEITLQSSEVKEIQKTDLPDDLEQKQK